MPTTEFPATVSSKGQVAVSSGVCKRLGQVPGSLLRFVLEADGVRLLAAAGDVRSLIGRLKLPAQAVTLADMVSTRAQRRARVSAA